MTRKKYTKQSQEIRKEPLLTWSMMNVLLDSLLALKILWLCIFSPKRGKREEQLITKRILHFSQWKLKPFASIGIKEIKLLLLAYWKTTHDYWQTNMLEAIEWNLYCQNWVRTWFPLHFWWKWHAVHSTTYKEMCSF